MYLKKSRYHFDVGKVLSHSGRRVMVMALISDCIRLSKHALLLALFQNPNRRAKCKAPLLHAYI